MTNNILLKEKCSIERKETEMQFQNNNYIGGIRPSRDDPSICSFASNVAIWTAFRTPGLEHIRQISINLTE